VAAAQVGDAMEQAVVVAVVLGDFSPVLDLQLLAR
jgi:hypothetical protein